ncbi:MAG TPA: MBL fold metallo-hydrolase [Polyangiaceae bacterium]|nr:MBL fold metallo-hydrolase [Polyangiaceae bacterium]
MERVLSHPYVVRYGPEMVVHGRHGPIEREPPMSEHPFGERPVPLEHSVRLAAIVVLVRRRGAAGADGPLELFIVRRARELKMFGGFVALLGGGLDPADGDSGDDQAFVQCAARELFEESGVLTVTDVTQVPASARDQARRALCQRGAAAAGFQRFLDEQGLAVDRARFHRAGRWVTPHFVPTRFDAHIFVVEASPEDDPQVWPGELTSGEWIDPATLVLRWEQGDVLLHPPQSHIACTLAAWNKLEEGSQASSRPRMASPSSDRDGADWDELGRAIATGGHRDNEQVATRIDFQRGIVMFPVVTPTLPPAQHTNVYIVGTGEFIVIDPGSPYADEQSRLHRLLDELRSEGHKPRAVVLTHHHEDHIGGAVAAAQHLGVPLLGHARTLDRVAVDASVAREVIEDGAILALAGPLSISLRAIFTPGHARGHLCFHDERSGALICGDMVSTLSTIIIDPPEGDLGQYFRSLERLKELRPRTLYPAHGLPTQHALEKLEEYVMHRRARAEALAAALSRGPRELLDLVAEVYADVPPMVHVLAARSALASLEWLASEGRVHPAGPVDAPTSRWVLV